MGGFKIGAEVCNNCVHWQCHAKRIFTQTEVQTTSNCDKCSLSGRNTYSDGTCDAFSHIGGVTKTFAYVPEPSISDYYLQGVMGSIRMESAGRIAEIARNQRRIEAANSENEKRSILIRNGMDSNASNEDQQAFEALYRGACDGEAKGLLYLGEAFRTNRYGAVLDAEKAVQLFKMAASKGSTDAELRLAESYLNGEGVGKDEKIGRAWLARAAEHGDAFAKNKLTKIVEEERRKRLIEEQAARDRAYQAELAKYVENNGMDPDASDMAKLLFSAMFESAKDGQVDAQLELADAYANHTKGATGDKARALFWYKKAAKQGNALAQNWVGRFYQMGWGCDVDFEKALMFFGKAAEQNDLAALNNLAVMYEKGQGCQKDVKKARELFAKAVAGDFSRAAYHLGRFYENGIGGDRDVSEAVKLYSKAADDGDADALVALAEIYLKGNDDVEQDMEKAVELLEEAANNKKRPSAKSRAKALLGECYENGWGVEEDEEKAGELYEEAAKDEKCALGCYNYGRFLEFGLGHVKWNLEKAVYYYRKAVVEEYVKAYCKMGDLHVVGRALKKDLNEAFKWYYKAAEQNDPYAQNMVAGFYKRGDGGVEKDYNAAFAWRMKAAEQGYAPAQTNVGECYVNGMGCEKDFAKALLWLEKAAEQGDVVATSDMGWCYEKGVGCDPDPVKAAYYYKKAAEQKNSTACNNLALMYENGSGVEKDLKKAYDLLVIAVKRGSARSCYHLGRFYENGLAVQADRAKAKEWYSKAAAKGDKDAKAALERLG